MNDSKHVSLRLDPYCVNIVERLKAEKGLASFTEAVRYIIKKYNEHEDTENNIQRIFQRLDKKITTLNSSGSDDLMVENHALLEELNDIGNNLSLILKALVIIGSADIRTSVDIEELFEGSDQ
jgi:metal-responsive CopG/Arc/MetJ family transcriptional regulator